MVDARAAKAYRMIEPRQPPIRETTNLDNEISRSQRLVAATTEWTFSIVFPQLPDLSLLEAHDRHLILTQMLSAPFQAPFYISGIPTNH